MAPGSFENRKSLPKAWMGLRDEELSQLSGIQDCVFVHANGNAHTFLTLGDRMSCMNLWHLDFIQGCHAMRAEVACIASQALLPHNSGYCDVAFSCVAEE